MESAATDLPQENREGEDQSDPPPFMHVAVSTWNPAIGLHEVTGAGGTLISKRW